MADAANGFGDMSERSLSSDGSQGTMELKARMGLGVSVPWSFMAGRQSNLPSRLLCRAFGGPDAFLSLLRSSSVASVEFRHWSPDLKLSEIRRGFRLAGDAKLSLSVHGDVDIRHKVKEIWSSFPWLDACLQHTAVSRESPLFITIHPVISSCDRFENWRHTVELISQYCREIDIHKLPITLAYENQRAKGNSDPAEQYDSMVSVLHAVESEHVGLCWDVGHAVANELSGVMSSIPPMEFLKQVVHTHIHDINPTTGQTHWPLQYGVVPVRRFVRLLNEFRFNGLLNLELSVERFSHMNLHEAFERSLSELSNALKETDS